MLSKEDNELITDTNPGTPMGELFRRFWLPVALSRGAARPGLPAGARHASSARTSSPSATRNGKPGLVDAFCPHRGAPMFFGRNEEDGLRCVYHGWKFDVTGECVDLPNAPEGDTYKNKVEIKSYPCEDKGDLIWAYMGPKDKQPPFPEFEWTKLPRSHRYVTKFVEQCNYLQAMEGDYDPSHARFLHSTFLTADAAAAAAAGHLLPARPTTAASATATRTSSSRAPSATAASPRGRGASSSARLYDDEAALLSVQYRDQPDGKVSASVGVDLVDADVLHRRQRAARPPSAATCASRSTTRA